MRYVYPALTAIKRIMIGMSGFCIANACYAETWLYFTNNTDYTVSVDTKNTIGNLSRDYWTNNPGQIPARNGDDKKIEQQPIAKFNRNEGLGYNNLFEFVSILTIMSQKVTLTTQIISAPCNKFLDICTGQGSTIKTKIQGPGYSGTKKFTDDYKPKTFTFTLNNGQTIQAQYRQYNSGTGDDQIYLILNQDHPNNYTISADANRENVIDVISYNTWMPRGMANKASYRKNEIPFHLKPFDIIVLEEVFNDEYRNDMRAALHKTHPYWTGPLNLPQNQTFQDDGGVVILSKWPIATDTNDKEIKDSKTYTHCPCDFNKEHKGAWYVKVLKHGTPYHIFGTHPVWNKAQTADIKTMAQIAELGKFIAKQNIPSNEAVLIAGDMNVFQHKAIYAQMLASLNAESPSYLSDAVLVNSHDETRNSDADGGTGTLDYVLYSKVHKQPVSSYVKVIPFMSPQINDNNGKGGYLLSQYLSDHFAKHGHFEFATNSSNPNYLEIKSFDDYNYTFSYNGGEPYTKLVVYRENETLAQDSAYTWGYTTNYRGQLNLTIAENGRYKAYLLDNDHNKIAGPVYFNKN
ncbi:sphingomyelin phosphodiesterase [Zooshikella harenae]|uniref:Sphingomyelin phosphodiesterase n=1 Tax=Zooshikella harenae TaxID=2827238 RepID=A0ABS5Z9U4_9GAMM|nr:sphingomyelin phosphodiesterase [Zooshikella harenae]MBU2710759.1 sphingomyelin phosphodiesterase [Zooshikella harenae]